MKNFITKDYKDIKERINIKKNMLLYEGLFLVFATVLVYFLDLKIGNLTVLYLFPLALILIALEYLTIANKYKKLNMTNWTLIITCSFLFLMLVLYLTFYIIPNKEAFIIWLGSIIILKPITDLLICKRLHVIEVIRTVFYLVLGILVIIFNKVIVSNLYLYLVIILFLIGISNLIEYFIIRKK